MYCGSGLFGKGDFWKFGLIFGLIYLTGLLVIDLPWLQMVNCAVAARHEFSSTHDESAIALGAPLTVF